MLLFGFSPFIVGVIIAGLYLFRAIGTWVYQRFFTKWSDGNNAMLLALSQGLGSCLISIPMAAIGLGGLSMR